MVRANDVLERTTTENILLNGLKHSLDMEKLADVTFTFVGIDKKLKAHKIILAMGSSVFSAEFSNDGNDQNLSMKPIEGITFEDFSVFIASFYKSDIEISDVNIMNVLSCAIKYKAHNCIRLCQKNLKVLNLKNVLKAYESTLSVLVDYYDLADRCKGFISKYIDAVISSDAFKKCTETMVIKNILELNLPRNEIKLINALIARAKYLKGVETLQVDELRKELEPFIGLIKFSDMDAYDFLVFHDKYKLLNIDELNESIGSIVANTPKKRKLTEGETTYRQNKK